MTKIDIVSGFLGAGKTTLIKKLIAEAFQGEKLVLIENEFGEIGIDGGFLKEAGIEITEMNSGCICCSLVGDFGTALREVLEKFQPDRILIEPSGVGKLSDVIRAVQGVAEDVDSIQLNSFVAVVDAVKGKMYMKNFGEFFNNQIESANTIVLSRTQNMSQDKLELVVGLLREHNEKAAIITTPWEQLTGKQILSVMEQAKSFAEEMLTEMDQEECDDPECSCHHDHGHHHHEHHHHDCDCHEHHHTHDCDCHEHEHHHHHTCDCGCHDHEHHHGHHHHHAADVFDSWGVETPHKYEKEALEQILQVLSEENPYGNVLRAKGMVETPAGQWLFFDLTPGEYEVREGVAEYTGRICVIGTDLKEDALAKLFMLV